MSAQHLNQLFEKARSGNPDAERVLFEYLTARFRLFARHRLRNTADGDEVVQEALVVICREYKSLDVTSSFAAWAYKVLDNRLINQVEVERKRQHRIVEDSAELQSMSGPAADFELRRRLLDCLRKIFAAKRRYGRAMNLHAQGYSTDEICRRMEVRENTLYSLLHRGRAMLKRCLETGEIR